MRFVVLHDDSTSMINFVALVDIVYKINSLLQLLVNKILSTLLILLVIIAHCIPPVCTWIILQPCQDGHNLLDKEFRSGRELETILAQSASLEQLF